MNDHAKVSMLIEIPEELYNLLQMFIQLHPEIEVDNFVATSIIMSLLLVSKGEEEVSKKYQFADNN